MPLPKDVISLAQMRKFPRNACACEQCVECCKRRPGVFLPGEPEKVAEYLGHSLHTLFKTHMIIDYWCDNRTGNIEYIIPAVTFQSGRAYAQFSDPFNDAPCMFLLNDKCIIHPVKPFECTLDVHDSYWDVPKDERDYNMHKSIIWQWFRGKINPWKLIAQ